MIFGICCSMLFGTKGAGSDYCSWLLGIGFQIPNSAAMFFSFSFFVDLLKLLRSVSSLKQGLRLFNLDMIREGGAGDHYYVIDINYFPGKDFWEFVLSLNRFSQPYFLKERCVGQNRCQLSCMDWNRGFQSRICYQKLKWGCTSAGYGKMPDYEFVFTDFLLSLARSKGRLGL